MTREPQNKVADVIRRAQKHMPAELWAQVRALLTPEAAAVMGTVTAAWAISHFFGVGEIADILLLVTGGAVFGTTALEIGQELHRFATLTRSAQTEPELERAAKHLANAIVLGGTTALSALLLRARPVGTFADRYRDVRIPRPGPRGPGWFYKPKIYVRPLDSGTLGATTMYGDIIINAKLPAQMKAETLLHEKVHRFLTARLYFLRELRVRLKWEGYNRSYLLRYLEEALAEANVMLRTGGGLLLAVTFPVRNSEYLITVAKMGQEARGILLGPVNVGGQMYRAFLTEKGPTAAGEAKPWAGSAKR